MPPFGQVEADKVVDELDDVVADLKGTAVLGEPIVGTEVVTLDEHGPGALAARALPYQALRLRLSTKRASGYQLEKKASWRLFAVNRHCSSSPATPDAKGRIGWVIII